MSRGGGTLPCVPQLDLTHNQRRFLESRRTATLATLSPGGRPRLVPICFILADSLHSPETLYSPLDEKPKGVADVRQLARVRDIQHRPEVSLLFEHWSEDWAELAWLRTQGSAELLEPHDDALALLEAVDALRAKYPQYQDQRIDVLPMIRIALDAVRSWSASDARLDG